MNSKLYRFAAEFLKEKEKKIVHVLIDTLKYDIIFFYSNGEHE
jgi:hypothetical protein